MALAFSRRPFRAAVAPDLFVAASPHEAALAQLRQCVESGPSIVDLTGDPGTGKTLLALKLLAEFAATRVPLYLPNAHYRHSAELNQAILHDLGQAYEGLTVGELWLAVSDAVLDASKMILVLDDADHLSDEVLADLRRFDNLNIRGEGAISIVLVGSVGLAERLRSLPALQSRLGRPIRLGTLSQVESVSYLREQAILAGGSDEAFTDEAASLIATQGHGVPRTLNRLAAEAIAIATDAGENMVDVEAVLAALPEEPAESAHADESIGAARQPRGARLPKEKARKRKAA